MKEEEDGVGVKTRKPHHKNTIVSVGAEHRPAPELCLAAGLGLCGDWVGDGRRVLFSAFERGR